MFGVFLVRMRENAEQENSEYNDTFYAVIYVTCTVQIQLQIFKQSSTLVAIECTDKGPRVHLFESYLKFRNVHDLEFIFIIL